MNKLVMLVGLLITTTAFAATVGSVTISGTVPAVTSIVVAPVGSYNALDLSSTQSDLTIANVTELNNTSLGYKVTISSANAGQLKNGSIGSVVYTAKYNGVSFTLSTTAVQVTNVTSQTSVASPAKPLAISYTGVPNANQMAGTYSDTLTFTIVAN